MAAAGCANHPLPAIAGYSSQKAAMNGKPPSWIMRRSDVAISLATFHLTFSGVILVAGSASDWLGPLPGEGVRLSIEVKRTPDAAHDLLEAFHEIRQPAATKRSARTGTVMFNPSPVAGPSIAQGLRLSAAAESAVKHGKR